MKNNIQNLKTENAICYSGYRTGQSPITQIYPSYEEIKEDLMILSDNWKYIRLYDTTEHARTALEVIRNEGFNLKVMIGVCLEAEVSNDKCPWGGFYSDEQLNINKRANFEVMQSLIELANEYPEIIFSVSAGNEATAEWTDHPVSVESIISYVRMIKEQIDQPVTFCENYIPWQEKLSELVNEVDFISLHTYPLWEAVDISHALDFTIENYNSVKDKYPNKTIVITEAGWATQSDGKAIPLQSANEDIQKEYVEYLTNWSRENNILTFVFEAFDEDWKGSHESNEPEKHWGLYTIDRKPKKFMKDQVIR